MTAMPGDPRGFEAMQRLSDHARCVDRASMDIPEEFRATQSRGRADLEMRVMPNTLDGQGGYAVPPLWLIKQWIAALRAGRAVADRCHPYPLPPGTDSINIPGTQTPTLTAVQASQGGGVASQDLTDRAVTGTVMTIAGQEDISLQLLEQSPGNFDEIVFQDLIADYNKRLDLQVLSGTGSNGQVTGLLNMAGTNPITFTQATPTVPLLYTPLAQGASQVARLRFRNADTIAMHPMHWWWIAASLDTQNRPLVEPQGGSAMNTIAVLDPNAAEGLAGSIAGLPVYVDANIPTNLGAGTNQAPILVGRFDDFYLYEGALRTRALADVLSGTLAIRLQVYNYMTFIPNRYAVALSVINGTGCITPAGF
jgi:HK97 family phage major capsid protein